MTGITQKLNLLCRPGPERDEFAGSTGRQSKFMNQQFVFLSPQNGDSFGSQNIPRAFIPANPFHVIVLLRHSLHEQTGNRPVLYPAKQVGKSLRSTSRSNDLSPGFRIELLPEILRVWFIYFL